MGENQPIIQRDNPLARKLAAIGELNDTYGTRAQGGAGAPIIEESPQPIGAGTVLPPPPVPVTPEEEAELQRKFDEQWGTPSPGPVAQVVAKRTPQIISGIGEVPQFAAIDLVNFQIVATNGAVYPITEKEQNELLRYAFKVFVRSVDDQISKVASAIGVEWPPKGTEKRETAKEATGGAANGEAVPPVSGDQAEK